MKNKLALIALLMAMALSANAQHMKHAIGARGGVSSGLTYQYFFQQDRDIKMLLSFRDNGVQLTALAERYEPLPMRFGNNFFLYYGMGAHLGITRDKQLFWRYHKDNLDDSSFPTSRAIVGADGIIGVEYRLYSLPFAFGLEYKPFFDLFGHRIFRLGLFDIGFTVKYHF
jgi:hypothetical protein